MYKLKYYYKNGDVKLSDKVNKIENFNTEIQMLTKNKNLKIEHNFKENLKNLLETIMKEYEKNFNDIYRIDIIDSETNKIIDYVDRSECLVDGKKGHLIYDAITGDVIDAVVKQTFEDCVIDLNIIFAMEKPKQVVLQQVNQKNYIMILMVLWIGTNIMIWAKKIFQHMMY